MNRNSVIVDGTKSGPGGAAPGAPPIRTWGRRLKGKPQGLNGIMVLKAGTRRGEPHRLQLPGGRGRRQRRQRGLVERRHRQRQDRRPRQVGLVPQGYEHLLQPRATRPPTGSSRATGTAAGGFTPTPATSTTRAATSAPARRSVQPDDRSRLGRVQRARVLGLELRRLAAGRELAVRQQRGRLRHQQPERRQPALATERRLPGRRAPRSGRTVCWVFSTTTSTTTTTPTSRRRGPRPPARWGPA